MKKRIEILYPFIPIHWQHHRTVRYLVVRVVTERAALYYDGGGVGMEIWVSGACCCSSLLFLSSSWGVEKKKREEEGRVCCFSRSISSVLVTSD